MNNFSTLLKRIFRHVIFLAFSKEKYFSNSALRNIEKEIQNAETIHDAEISVVIETALDVFSIIRGKDVKDRALEVFSQKRIWDTENNIGILFYILLADRKFEIIADRGISKFEKKVSFEKIASEITNRFQRSDFEEGVLFGIQSLSKLIPKHYGKKKRKKKNEIANKPVVL